MTSASPISRRVLGFKAEPLVWAGYKELDVSGLVGWGPTGGDGESMVVSGVIYEYEDEFFEAAATLTRIEEALLVLELSEPTVLGMSARRMSMSSAGVCAGAGMEGSRLDVATV